MILPASIKWDSVQNPRITMSFVAAVIAPTASFGFPIDAEQVTKKTILAAVAKKYRLRADDLTGSAQRHAVAHPRQEAMYLMRRMRRSDGTYRYSLPEIGRFLGGRDHTTVLFGVRAHCKRNGLTVP